MASAGRRTPVDIAETLVEHPQLFEFFQAVRLLELEQQVKREGRRPVGVGGSLRPDQEVVRFFATHSLEGHSVDLHDLDWLEDAGSGKGGRWRMDVGFMVLTGSAGVLPYHYSELIHQRARVHDYTLKAFLDIFNHRVVALHYRAWKKYRVPFNIESHAVQGCRGVDGFSDMLLSLMGMGTTHTVGQTPAQTAALCSLAGILSRPIRSGIAIEKMLQFFIGMPVKVRQFQGQWLEIPEDTRTRLPSTAQGIGVNNQLGVNALLGQSGWQVQSKFSVELTDVSYAELMKMRPDGDRMQELRGLTRLAAGTEFDFDVRLRTRKREIPPMRLRAGDGYQPLLGWNTVLGGEHYEDEKITIVLH
jgi:type VI secretion system protein ImpH